MVDKNFILAFTLAFVMENIMAIASDGTDDKFADSALSSVERGVDLVGIEILSNSDTVFVFSGDKLLLDMSVNLPGTFDLLKSPSNVMRRVDFIHDGRTFTAIELKKGIEVPANLQLVNFVSLYMSLPTTVMGLARKANQLLEWERLHQFCGACGTNTQQSTDELVKICLKESCGQKFYPKILPVVVVAVEKGEELLLARSTYFPPEIYTTIAGFVEAGETVEEAAAREVFEETGIEISDLQYFGSQSWQFPTQLIFGFQAKYKSGELKIQQQELEHAAFFHVSRLPKTFPGNNITISQRLISNFQNRMLMQTFRAIKK
ncbi:MAG: NAD(+) diphosphatase [Alphaproteobacteria bacterium]|nr:NAD(+) diphosphatase [Alphaproteobacteria bacterium]